MKVTFKTKELDVKEPITINELLKDEIKENKYVVVGAIFNNEYVNLNYEIKEDGKIKLLDTSTKEGSKIYRRTLTYILGKAFEKVCKGKKINVNYQLSNAIFCDIENTKITDDLIETLTDEMRRIVRENLPIKQVIMNREEAKEFYQKNDTSKGRLQYDLEQNEKIYMYYCEDYYNYCYGTLASSTGLTKVFELVKYEDGFLMRYPSSDKPGQLPKIRQAKKLSWALEEYNDIHKILNMNRVYRLNSAVENNTIKDVIMLDEALHEKKIANIADKIARRKKIKMILIAGPSSSGKTTFAQRLGIQLRINGLKPVTISVDNYFVERKTPQKIKMEITILKV